MPSAIPQTDVLELSTPMSKTLDLECPIISIQGSYDNIASQINMTKYRPFLFTATQDQTQFVLDFTPQSVIWLAINGAIQSSQQGDFSLVGNTITTNEGLNAGNKLFGLATLW
jgi:hypothetical protein